MAYTAGNGIGRAKLLAIKALIQANISGLNSALAANSDTAFLVQRDGIGEILSQHVVIGRLTQAWRPVSTAPHGGPVRICVCQDDATTFSATPRFANMGLDWQYTFSTSILICVHPEMFQNQNSESQSSNEQLVMMGIEDWFRAGLFNKIDNGVITLTSNEYGGGGDILVECRAESGEQGVSAFSFGSAFEFPTVHIRHRASIY